ncbi:MarR family winged helix-turn-helix transcriptional regulator [Porcipelethomonas sp.]|uniref:MarR family winged helix-turn-helix transcriptional regulator n=1 Tax=Porcipelethomonas sp. TaxID=2981675 RepID=UPI003EF2C0F7
MNYEHLTEKLMDSLRNSYYKPPISDCDFFLQGEHKLLNHLYICENKPKKPVELCRELSMTSARVSAALKILEKKGFIKREQAESDKRSVMISLTDEGIEYIIKARRSVYNDVEKSLRRMGDDAQEFVRLIARAAEIIEKAESGRKTNEYK